MNTTCLSLSGSNVESRATSITVHVKWLAIKVAHLKLNFMTFLSEGDWKPHQYNKPLCIRINSLVDKYIVHIYNVQFPIYRYVYASHNVLYNTIHFISYGDNSYHIIILNYIKYIFVSILSLGQLKTAILVPFLIFFLDKISWRS